MARGRSSSSSSSDSSSDSSSSSSSGESGSKGNSRKRSRSRSVQKNTKDDKGNGVEKEVPKPKVEILDKSWNVVVFGSKDETVDTKIEKEEIPKKESPRGKDSEKSPKKNGKPAKSRSRSLSEPRPRERSDSKGSHRAVPPHVEDRRAKNRDLSPLALDSDEDRNRPRERDRDRDYRGHRDRWGQQRYQGRDYDRYSGNRGNFNRNYRHQGWVSPRRFYEMKRQEFERRRGRGDRRSRSRSRSPRRHSRHSKVIFIYFLPFNLLLFHSSCFEF